MSVKYYVSEDGCSLKNFSTDELNKMITYCEDMLLTYPTHRYEIYAKVMTLKVEIITTHTLKVINHETE